MKPGHGEVLIAEGDVEVAEEEELLVQEFRRQLEEGMWAAVPERSTAGRREARMVRAFEDVPRDAERVIFFPRAAGGALSPRGAPSTMLLASIAIGVVIVALLWDLVLPSLKEAVERHRARRALIPGSAYDPGRERRAEQRARQLLQSCVNEEEWAMYRDLGFIRVWGGHGAGAAPRRASATTRAPARPYAYLVYPHKPIVAYLPADARAAQRVLRRVPRRDAALRQLAPARLRRRAREVDGAHRRRAAPIATANMHLPGRQVDPKQVRRDLWRLSQWERERLRRTPRSPGGVAAP